MSDARQSAAGEKDMPSVRIYEYYNFPILLKVQGRVKIFVNMATSGLSPEHENGTPSALQTGETMIFFKQVRCYATVAQINEVGVKFLPKQQQKF